MNVKKLCQEMFVVVCLIASVLFCFCINFNPTSVFAYSDNEYSIVYQDGNTEITGSVEIEYQNASRIILKLNTKLNQNQVASLTYYYLKGNSPYAITDAITDFESNPYGATYNNDGNGIDLLSFNGPGTYKIVACIKYKADTNIENIWIIDKGFTITILNPGLTSTYDFKVSYQKSEKIGQKFATYTFYSELLLSGTTEAVSDEYYIYWYFNGSSTPISNKKSFSWTPTEAGNYRVSAELHFKNQQFENEDDSSTFYLKSDCDVINVEENNEVILILGSIALAGVLTLFVVLSSIIKVKRERVW